MTFLFFFWGNRHVLLPRPQFMQRYFYTLIIAVSWCVHYYDDAADDSVLKEKTGNLREKVRWKSVICVLQDKSSEITTSTPHHYLLLLLNFECNPFSRIVVMTKTRTVLFLFFFTFTSREIHKTCFCRDRRVLKLFS